MDGRTDGLTEMNLKWAESVGNVAAPLLAGFGFTAVVVVGEDPGKFRWADATILSLTLSVVTLIAAVQCSKYARNEHRHAERWYGGTRILYHTGIVALLLGLGFVLAPLHAVGVPDAPRWAACGIAFGAASGEAISFGKSGLMDALKKLRG
jgi:hypothetical protein